jgi:polar amino acid transport system substrate-binding protein
MGVETMAGVPQDFSTMIPGLIAHRFDINSAFYISAARCKQVQFSAPIWVAQESFIVKAGNPKNLHSYEDLAKDGTAKIGLLTGAVEKKLMPKVGVKDEQIVTFNDQASILAALRTGRIDAFVATSIGNQKLLEVTGDKDLEKADPFHPSTIDGKLDVGYGAFTFRSEDKDFVEEFNKQLVAFLGTPEHLALIKPYGFTEADIKPILGLKTEDLCKG